MVGKPPTSRRVRSRAIMYPFPLSTNSHVSFVPGKRHKFEQERACNSLTSIIKIPSLSLPKPGIESPSGKYITFQYTREYTSLSSFFYRDVWQFPNATLCTFYRKRVPACQLIPTLTYFKGLLSYLVWRMEKKIIIIKNKKKEMVIPVLLLVWKYKLVIHNFISWFDIFVLIVWK